MPPNLPGFYWDPSQNRYFKTQTSATAPPPSAPWSSTSVKRRKTEAEATQKIRKRKHQIRRNIKRSPVDDFWTFSGPLRAEIEGGRWVRAGDVGTAGWAQGVEGKGGVRFGEDRGDGVNLGAFWVEEDVTDKGMGKGAIWATSNGTHIQCRGIQTNSNGNIRAFDTFGDSDYHYLPTNLSEEGTFCEEISSINYDPTKKKTIITSRTLQNVPGYITLRCHDEESVVQQEIGVLVGAAARSRGTTHGSWNPYETDDTNQSWSINTCVLAPKDHRSSHVAYGYLGTDEGAVAIPHDSALYPKMLSTEKYRINTEIFDIAFQPGQGNGVILAGGRTPKIWPMDFRAHHVEMNPGYGDGQRSEIIEHVGPIAHLRFVSENQVLAAGPRSIMALYDIRFSKTQRLEMINPNYRHHHTRPLHTFPTYDNEARFNLGFDVSPDGQTVVAAQGDGGVKVYSVQSGMEVKCPALEEGVGMGQVVRKLKFGRERGDLYAGLGGRVVKFGFGTDRVGDI